jgi:YrbI family 3-deoxy-D-manno-octulosonate 8-phosphate phosphatase
MERSSVAAEIRLFVTDVDGTMTDGGMYYTAHGDHMKRFNTRDGMGLSMLRDAGIEVAMMTGEDSEIVVRRAEKLKIQHVYVGVSDKLSLLREVCGLLDVPLGCVAYVGDDVNDLEVIKNVGLALAVSDADFRIAEAADVRLSLRGGEGAVREAAEWILARRTSKVVGADQ